MFHIPLKAKKKVGEIREDDNRYLKRNWRRIELSLMNNLNLPESSESRKRAHERLIAQLLTRASLIFPTEEIDKEVFLSDLIVQYKENKTFSSNLNCKWGRINDPVGLLESLKDKPWEFIGVKKFYDFYMHRKNMKRLEKEERRELNRLIREGIKEQRRLSKENKKKYSSWDEPLRKQLEQELNDYGKKYGVRSYIEHLKNWKNEWFEIKGIIGVFDEYATYTCSYTELKRELKEMIRDSVRYPEELKEIQEEMEYLMGD